MFDWLHNLWRYVVLWFEADRGLAFLCLAVALAGVFLWFWLKKWKNRYSPLTPVMTKAGSGHGEGGSVRGDLLVLDLEQFRQGQSPLVLEWEVCMTEQGVGDIGDLERRLLHLQNLHLDSAYDVMVSLFSSDGASNQRIAEILGRRFPGYTFFWEGERVVQVRGGEVVC